MGIVDKPPLTFALIDSEIEALPEGPVAMLRAPRWIVYWSFVGIFGMVLSLMPSLLLQWLAPQLWMLALARAGLAITLIGFAPGFVRSVWVLAHEFRHHRRGMIEQFDHDVARLRDLTKWLSAYPREALKEQLRYARIGHERLGSRLTMMVGGIERLGLLPLLLSLFVMLRNWRDLLALPTWLALLALMLAMLWVIGWMGAEFRRRLQLYEFLLQEALHRQPRGGGAGDAAT